MNTNTIDHLVYLTPPGTLEEICDEFQQIGFQVLPGGIHADGLTANALIVFEDHAYFELINFTHPADYYKEGTPLRLKRDTHPWSESFKQPGFVAFAFLGNGSIKPEESVAGGINQRAEAQGLPSLYTSEIPGGRTRPDGEVLKWLISNPIKGGFADSQAALPFFCGDVTSRSLRVPVAPPSNTQHRSGAKGVASIRLLISTSAELSTIATEISTVLNKPAISTTPYEVKWEIETPTQIYPTHFIVGFPQNEEEVKYVEHHRGGVYEVVFWTNGVNRESKSTQFGGLLSWI